jgi:Ca2+-binding RTX toxin-like protein
MNRLYNLLTVMVVMVGAFFAGHEALAKVLTGTGNDCLWGGHGNDEINPGHGNDKVYVGYGDLIYARDTDGVDYIACGGGFDKVKTIHRDDNTLSNCERTLGPDRGDI